MILVVDRKEVERISPKQWLQSELKAYFVNVQVVANSELQ